MSTPIAGPLAVTPLYVVTATDAVAWWNDPAGTWEGLPVVTGGPFLPLSGGTISGNLAITGTLSVTGATTLDGTTATTPATADNSTHVATTAYVKAQGYQTGNQTITLSGDATGSGTTAIPVTLATVNSNVGTYNNITINAKGLATAGSNVAYLTGNQTITLSGDISGSGTTAITATLPTVNANVGTFAIQTVNAKGLVTAAANMTGDVTTAAGVATLATVNSNVGTFQGITVNAKGLVTAAANQNYVTGGPYLPLTGGTLSGALTVQQGISTTGSNATLWFQDRGLAATWAWYASSNIARLYNGSADVVTITPGGAITQTAAGSYFYMANGSGAIGANGGPLIYADTTSMILKPGSGNGGVYVQNYAGTTLLQVSPSLIETFQPVAFSQYGYPTANNTTNFGYVGQGWATITAYNFYNPSDLNEKEIVGPVPDCLGVVRRVTPQRYHFATPEGLTEDQLDKRAPDRDHWGFIAQDVGAAIAETGCEFAGHWVKDDHHLLAYGELIPILWKAVQELSAMVLKSDAGRE